jgi:hypothetical protein
MIEGRSIEPDPSAKAIPQLSGNVSREGLARASLAAAFACAGPVSEFANRVLNQSRVLEGTLVQMRLKLGRIMSMPNVGREDRRPSNRVNAIDSGPMRAILIPQLNHCATSGSA